MSVKEKKRGRPAGKSRYLSNDIIIEQAKTFILSDGKNPSIRQLALSLNVDAMSIYHYFKNKDALLKAITTSLVDGIYMPKENSQWQTELALLCRSYLTLLKQYSGLLETLLSMKSEGPAAIFEQRFNIVVATLSLNEENTENALNFLVDYLHGFALSMKCNKEEGALNIEMISGPLSLYCKSLSQPDQMLSGE
jgi:AcrR family transcriptional regulator